LTLYASILGTAKALRQSLEGRKAYAHVIQTSGYNEWQATGASVKFSTKGGDEVELREGDGAYVDVKKKGTVLEAENVGDRAAELLVFDLGISFAIPPTYFYGIHSLVTTALLHCEQQYACL